MIDTVKSKSVLLYYMVSKSFRLSSEEVEFIQSYKKLKDFDFESDVIREAIKCLKARTKKQMVFETAGDLKNKSKNVEFLIAGKLSNPKYDQLLLQEYQDVYKEDGMSLKNFVESVLEWDLDKLLTTDEYCITKGKTNKEFVLQ